MNGSPNAWLRLMETQFSSWSRETPDADVLLVFLSRRPLHLQLAHLTLSYRLCSDCAALIELLWIHARTRAAGRVDVQVAVTIWVVARAIRLRTKDCRTALKVMFHPADAVVPFVLRTVIDAV